ncbi:haloacid dehalogenase-like hydrolase domain-containing protein 3 [Protopterus annectens]|uniref:haloacid dehalogenase-like hydrolase domain-containing protein 3 n=1 Tax=Protopterus annectens TaxID=7888 RepID=UPI001CFB8215|nr:haloacid dehalogenase-like hydrolase domain-containing protein 3 [Protopterus annectens]XP_043914605.1 haloacid dehalogenase-like hydrolase domain-containing protein 3 [Protopterus annectens]XP_043914606.1 haloacid dehalogenase-like hydrolase domain-containing protein 3 [Protopterus annectens]XP_043914609.1 haloacid dehalogenase-like hydrolase domain-containing protein 3 [Protopterus annectens]XP_043914610.1 haloacid dehalogenase-like hydrolase domain-containing protein 3 [Protopterus annect
MMRLLTWDVKDTLIRIRHSVGEQYYSEAKSHGLRVDPEILNKCFHLAYRRQKEIFPNYGLGSGLNSRQWWIDTAKLTFRLCGIEEERVLSPIAEKLYTDFCTAKNWEVFPDVQPVLTDCKKLGFRMAVISNFDRRLEQILLHCNLRQYFEFVMTSEEAGIAKPNTGIFLKTISVAGVDPKVTTHIGDDYWNDYRAAREAGFESYLLKREGDLNSLEDVVPMEYVIQSLEELPTKLMKLC